jgi:hypothetical protein
MLKPPNSRDNPPLPERLALLVDLIRLYTNYTFNTREQSKPVLTSHIPDLMFEE